MEKILEILNSLRREHYQSEDCWYSCPKSVESDGYGGGCCDDSQDKDKCNCGTDFTNQKIDELVQLLSKECEWNYKGSHVDYYDTSCGVDHMFMGGTVADNHYKFCPYCGKIIKDVSIYEKT